MVDRKVLGELSEDPSRSRYTYTEGTLFPLLSPRFAAINEFTSPGSSSSTPHGRNAQAQYVAQERSEVWVNIEYRLSVFGFLTCDEPKIDGNFGFKDQWLVLQWLQENIEGFAGAHSVHQILHHVSHHPEGQKSPIKSVVLQSDSDGTWIPTCPDSMTWQRSGRLTRKLREKGLTSSAIGDLSEEWYLYAIAHPVHGPRDVFPNILRYYPLQIVERLVEQYRALSNWLVTHGTDRCFRALRVPSLTAAQKEVAVAWLDAIDKEFEILEREGKPTRPLHQALTLREDQTIAWQNDKRWDQLMNIAKVLPGRRFVNPSPPPRCT
ncbi:Alpha/Beta hydrolase protein [Butyriboletus roseoflavus]|nr:Alpha/Beta hydrolase protein [Butyriboletus roseoflavus]